MPDAWGASARSLPTFLVPDTADEGLDAGGGLVWVAQAVAQPKQAHRSSIYFMAKGKQW